MALRVLLSPFAIGVAFRYLLPGEALLPRTYRLFEKIILVDEEETTRKARLTKEERVEPETKRETGKETESGGYSSASLPWAFQPLTGSDLPIVLAFAQLLKANQDALLTAMAEKGGMVEFETKIADAFDRVVLKERTRGRTQ